MAKAKSVNQQQIVVAAQSLKMLIPARVRTRESGNEQDRLLMRVADELAVELHKPPNLPKVQSLLRYKKTSQATVLLFSNGND